MVFPSKYNYIFFGLLLTLLTSCATYYQKNYQLQNYIVSGDFNAAEKLLNKDTKSEKGINRVLFYMNQGMVNFTLGNYEKSNYYLNKADLYNEDYKSGYGNEALALISNPMVKPYKPEDFENVMVHYYKSLNYLMLQNYEEALVECRRVNIILQQLNDKYKKTKNKYSNDAFAHNLMGMIYDASGDKNNAFIAYRNAYEAYENSYSKLFNVKTPDQLKKDLVRTAYQSGLEQEYSNFSNLFNLEYNPESEPDGSLVFLWMNGFGPVKSEWSINFINSGYNDGWITFANEEYGLNFPIYIGNRKKNEQSAFRNLSFVRIAFPKYIEREPVYKQASVRIDSLHFNLELSQDINAIAFQSLQDRMVRELANGIARLVTKKALEQIANSENKNLGSVISIINAITEKADTRNWQSLPYSIYYSRIPLKEGKNKIELEIGQGQQKEKLEFNIKKGEDIFFTYHQLESYKLD
ncbi:COG3014 family protein [Plebeiibacterium sediminum]|uniref:Tetratricopeptide repeat protein n=1 Tax=Plebeiibacterium sediminum TaxID=2992112 RepID=A0AAE3M4T0_9BACT|nr:hypothetical protein [Plebeiobacterium sediminum]MCW3786909.1 hypothetical protein [Plebeiobacterium sediminum]